MVDTQPPTRKSRARERHERRKARQQDAAPPGLSPRSAPRHLSPAGRLTLPDIRLPQARMLLYIAAGAGIILVVIFVLGRLADNTPQTRPNAIWIGTQWTYDAPADEAVSALAGRLRSHQIGTVYAWVSLLQPDGTWTDTIKLNQVEAFVQQFRDAYPEARLYGWLSIAAQGEDGLNRLGDAAIQEQVADFSRRMTQEFGFDGVFLNVVPVLDGDEDFLSLLRRVRMALGDGGRMAVAVPPDWTPPDDRVPQPPQIAPNTFWDDNYKRRVALLSDEMVITAYNSGLAATGDYAAWVAYQVQAFATVIAEMATSTQLLIGIPAYDTPSPEHRPEVENIASAVQGVRDGLQQAGDAAQIIQGLAIYAEWDTDDAKWEQFRRGWLGR